MVRGDVQSQWRLPMMGMAVGPGGRLPLLRVLKKKKMVEMMKMKRVVEMTSQVSTISIRIVVCLFSFYSVVLYLNKGRRQIEAKNAIL